MSMTNNGIRQGCAIFLFLFNSIMDDVNSTGHAYLTSGNSREIDRASRYYIQFPCVHIYVGMLCRLPDYI